MVRQFVVALGLFAVLCTAALAQEAPPQAPPKLEDHPLAVAFKDFSKAYQAAEDASTLGKFEESVAGQPVVWIGVITDIPATGQHLVVEPLVSEAKKGFEAFIVAKLETGESLATIAKPGQRIMLQGVITSLGTSGPIVVAQRFALEQKPNDAEKVE